MYKKLLEPIRQKNDFAKNVDFEMYLATQFFFEAKSLIDWEKHLNQLGNKLPIHAGIPGPASIKTLINYARSCGIGNSLRFISKQAFNLTKLATLSTPDKLMYDLSDYILLFPFCSEHFEQKKWPYYDQLTKIIKQNHSNIKIVIAPGPGEMEKAKKLDAVSILNEEKAISISELAGLIKKSKFVVANDTGPAHMAAHLNVKGLSLFGSYTTAYKVSIERENFKAIQVSNLKNLSAEKVFERLVF